MTIIHPAINVPYPRHPKQLIRNERIPPATVGAGIINGLNHVLTYQQKSIASYGVDVNNLQTSQAAAHSIWRGYFQAGRGAIGDCEVRFRTLLAPAGNAAATDPVCYWEVTRETGGVVVTDSSEIHYGPFRASWGLDHLHESIVSVPITNTQEHSYRLVCSDHVQPVSASAYIWHPTIYDTSDNAIVGDPSSCTVGRPITLQQANDMRAIGDVLHNLNGAHLANWACDGDPDVHGAVCPTVSDTTMVNIFDPAQNVWAANDPGIRFQVQHQQPAHKSADVEITMAVYAKDAGDGGGGGTGKVMLYDTNGEICTTTGHSAAGDWQKDTGVLDGSIDTHECQFFVVSDAGSAQMDVYAVSVWTYIASGGMALQV